MRQTNFTILIFLICILALLIRLPGVFWGIDGGGSPRFVSYVLDEIQMSHMSTEFVGRFIYEDEQHYPKGYPFQMAMASYLLRPFSEYIDTPEFTLAGRLISVLYGVLTVLFLFRLVAELTADFKLALFSALFLTLTGIHVTRSHLAMPDIAATFWVCFLMYFSLLYIRTKKLNYFIAVMISTGMALAIKMPFFCLIPIIYLMVMSRLGWKKNLIVLLAIFVVFYLANGGKYSMMNLLLTMDNVVLDNLNVRQFNKFLNPICYFFILISSLGLPIFVLMLGGMFKIIFHRANIRITNYTLSNVYFVIFLPLALHFISICFIAFPADRHILPLVPWLAVLAAVGLCAIMTSMKFFNKSFFVLVIGLIVSYQLIYIGSLEYNCLADTRQLATRWIKQNIPSGETIALPKYSYLPRLERDYKIVDLKTAKYIVLHEAYFSRYSRTIMNPFTVYPKWEEVFHGNPVEFNLIQRILKGEASYRLVQRFDIKLFTPEMILLRKMFGNLWDGGIGDVLVYKKADDFVSRK